MTLKFDWWPRKIIGHLFYITSSFVHHLKPLGEFELQLLSVNAQFGSKSVIFCPVWPWNSLDDLEQGKSEGFDSCDRPSNLKLDSNLQFFHPCDREIWLTTLQNNRAPLLCYFKLCALFGSHWWIQTWVTVLKRTPNLGQIRRFLEPCDLEIWRMTLQNNRAPLLCYFKLCASFCSHWWIQTWVTVRKRLIWVKFDDF